MATNIVCSETYLDAFSKLDKKTQKKSLETIRFMQRSLRSDSLKIEKLDTRLDFKSARVTQDFRVIFTQAGNTILLVYIDHHDDAYLWAEKRLQGFDAVSVKPACEYFEQSKKETFASITDEWYDLSDSKEIAESSKNKKPDAFGKPIHNQTEHEVQNDHVPASSADRNIFWSIFLKFLFFLVGVIVGAIIMYFI